MIDLRFGLFWSGPNFSYLRYLCFKSLRYFHPNSEIILFYNEKYETKYSWSCEQQDFEDVNFSDNYLSELKKINVEIINFNKFSNFSPNYQSDFFRYWFLKEYGGFYLDNDQIILKSFDNLDLNYDFISSRYKLSWGCDYYPVGVIGAVKNSEIVNYTSEILPKLYNPNDYNSIGPWGMKTIFDMKTFKDKVLWTDPEVFYPVKESCHVKYIYEKNYKIPENSLALHWFAGHPDSQIFNKKFNEEFCLTSNDTISSIVKKYKFFN